MKRNLPKDRPPPLKITRPGDALHHHPQQPQQHAHAHAHGHPPFRSANPHHRQPIIIHTYSPEVIQIEPDNFRQLVQSLTGPASSASLSHAAPPPKRPRIGVPPSTGNLNPNFSSTQGDIGHNPPQNFPHPHPGPSPRDMLVHQEGAMNPYAEASSSYANLPHNPLLSPSMFNFSPSVLPSPSAFSFDYPSPMGPRGGAGLPSPLAPGGAAVSPWGFPRSLVSPRGPPTPRSLAAALPSPGPLSSTFLAELPVLSPAAYSWIEKNAESADAILASRPLMTLGLPPRPPPTTTANLFPASSSTLEDQKPSVYREK